MKIRNISGLSAAALEREATNGAKFIQYAYTVSFLITTIKRESSVYMVRPSKSSKGKQLFFTLVSCLFGWWGIPNGPKQTLASIRTNLKGGKDVTDEVMATVAGHILFQEAQKQQKATAV